MSDQLVIDANAVPVRMALRQIAAVIVVGACAIGAGAAARAWGSPWSLAISTGVFFFGQVIAMNVLSRTMFRRPVLTIGLALGFAALGVLLSLAVR